jgi:hypothetical protein
MREVAFSVIDLNQKAWARLLDVDQPIHLLLPNLVQALGMPTELNYVIIPKGMDQPLDAKYSLSQYRIPGGAELHLRPLRDQVLKWFLDKLYDEIKDEIKGQLIDAAKTKLKQILNLDPNYPDPLQFKDYLFGTTPQLPPQQVTAQQLQYQQQQYQQQPKSSAWKGWLIAGIVTGGVGLLTVGAIVLFVLYKLLTATPTPTATPNEPVLGTGDVQVTLRWSAPVDLDLHVTDPYGEEISFTSPSSSSGGILDVDANGGCNSMMASPVENIYWPTGGAPSGKYQVSVVYYTNCSFSGPVDFTVTIKQNNQVVNVLDGTVSESGETRFVTSFDR